MCYIYTRARDSNPASADIQFGAFPQPQHPLSSPTPPRYLGLHQICLDISVRVSRRLARKIDFPTSHLQHPCEVQEIILPYLPCDLGSPVEVDSFLLSNLGGEPPAPLAAVCLLHAPPAVILLKPFRSWSRIEEPGRNRFMALRFLDLSCDP